MFLFQTIQRSSVISFPMLGDLSINPPASFSLFGLNIYFYGVIIAMGFLLGALYCAYQAKDFGVTTDDVYDFLLCLIPASIVGARLYYVVFRLDYYLANPGEILNLREGGLAIYGGILFGILAAWLVCRKKKIPVFAFLDLIVFGLLIGQCLGRWGNFFNREAFGAETSIFCRMGLTAPDGTQIFVHPTFLYESLWNLATLLFLIWFNKKGLRKFDGQNLLIYFLSYGIGRFWIEGLRTDSLYIGATNIRASQALSLVLILLSAVLLLWQGRKPRDPSRLYAHRAKNPPDGEEPQQTENQEQTQI